MRKILLACLLFMFALSALAASAPAAAPATGASSAAPLRLTPEEARQALDVLNDPTRRSQIEDTLRAVAAAGALSALPASAPASASSATAASGVPAAFERNGLASQLARQGAHWLAHGGASLRHSVAALLDVSSVRAWWHNALVNPDRRALLGRVVLALLVALVPALAFEWLAHRLLRRPREALIARHAKRASEAKQKEQEQEPQDAALTSSVTPLPDTSTPADASQQAHNAAHHWSLLVRLPGALLHTIFKALPVVVFMIVATVLMSILTDDNTADGRVLDALIDLYVSCRGAVIISGFFLQPDAPALRLWRMGDPWAALVHRWVIAIASVVGVGAGLAETASQLGMNEDAHLALLKTVALIAHVMVSILILQCRQPVAARIRARVARMPSMEIAGDWLADGWAYVAVFAVMALWFVWALDVHNGYQALLHLGTISLAVLVAARVVSILVIGALGRAFNVDEDAQASIAQQHASRYYPLARRTVSTLLIVITALVLLQVWGLNVAQFFSRGTVGHRLASAVVTVSIAVFVALVVWEWVNVSIERRLAQWTTGGDLVRAARLRTLLPMLRSALFIVIALVVVLTGLSELGVNTAPLLASASIFGVALGFGSQKLVQDFITGIFLLMENAMQVGDFVTLAGVSGTVEYLSIRTVRLRGGDGSLYTVPFSSVSTVNNTNRGLGNAAVRVSIAYGQDVDRAIETLKEIGTALRNDDAFRNGILSDFSFWGVDAVDGAAITLAGQMQCRDTARWSVQREFNRRIAATFQARDIQIANPNRNLLVQMDGTPGTANAAPDAKPAASTQETKSTPASKTASDNKDA
ncbi:mechanosensitive ion channel family protein [Paraburkholderia sartisoli]|uniref:Small-conductance mechanosensitive channel n=1 Tax=Paraburkholderia sartisoli TaxID=83784 RepID=A0A1H4F3B2_9BURK|nr:mechanosensitive ion channel domain-containing protein [Paraburkholderia sartisoli]SEA91773.1 Small-conductance mechanosensitive channel [Paraburkholderia sartisoli]